MKCASGNHSWFDELDASRCCNPNWLRIIILPGERLRDAMEHERISKLGTNYSSYGFKFVWMYVGPGALIE